MATKGKEKATWLKVICDRFSGQGRFDGQPMRAKKARSATPRQISGITIGSATAPS